MGTDPFFSQSQMRKMGSVPILVTGGLGYIGSHTCVVLAEAGYELAIVDNLSNSKASVLERIHELAPQGAKITLKRADVRDRAALEPLLKDVKAVLHFAGLKAVGESVEKPLLYYENNVGGTIALLQAMDAQGVRELVFSSSATVYRSEEHTSELQSPCNLVCRLLLEKKKK